MYEREKERERVREGGEEKEREIRKQRLSVRALEGYALYFMQVFINGDVCVTINRSNPVGYPTMPNLDLPPFVLNYVVDYSWPGFPGHQVAHECPHFFNLGGYPKVLNLDQYLCDPSLQGDTIASPVRE